MAEPKIDKREVRKIRVAMAQDGAQKAARRFDENSPEFREAQRQRQSRRVYAADQQKGRMMSTTDKNEKKQAPAAQQRSAQAQRTKAREQAVARQRQQAQRNARIRENRGQQQSQGQGM